MDACFHAIALVGIGLCQLAHLVSAAIRVDMEGTRHLADDGCLSAYVCWHFPFY